MLGSRSSVSNGTRRPGRCRGVDDACSAPLIAPRRREPFLSADAPRRLLPHARAVRGHAAGRGHAGAGGALSGPLPPVPQAVPRLVGGGLDAVPPPHRRHPQLPRYRAPRLALLAPGDHRVDSTGAPLGGAGLFPPAPLAPGLPGAGALPTGLVVHRDLPARSVPLGRRPRGAVPLPRHALDRVELRRLSPPCRLGRGGGAGTGILPMGPAPPRLPVPAGAGRLEPVGLLPRYPVRAGGGSRDRAAGAGRSAARSRRALGALG